MSTLTDVIDRLRARIEIDPSVRMDATGREPDTYVPNTLYVFPTPAADQVIENDETGPARRQTFSITAVYLADAPLEEASQKRSGAPTGVLSSKSDGYLARLADVESCDLWDYLRAEIDMDNVRNFEGRAVAVRISGFRFLA